jgi:hypothetical protein
VSPARLKVWSWWQRDPASGQELAFVIAADKRGVVDRARSRQALSGIASVTVLTPGHSGFTAAMEQPFRLRWMALDDYVARSDTWLWEEQLDALRGLGIDGRRSAAG